MFTAESGEFSLTNSMVKNILSVDIRCFVFNERQNAIDW